MLPKLTYEQGNIMMIDPETQFIFEEVAKLPRTTDTCGITPDVLDLVYERFWNYDFKKTNPNPK